MTKNIKVYEILEKYETMFYSTVLLTMIGIVIASVIRSAIFI